MDIVVNLIVGIMSGLISALATLAITERHRRPHISFSVGEPRQDKNGRIFLSISVKNDPIPAYLSWLYDRQPALMCRAWISFHLSGDNSRIYDKEFIGRWQETAEPIIYQLDGSQKLELDKARLLDWVDIPPDEGASLDVVFKNDGTEKCAIWNTETYFQLKKTYSFQKVDYIYEIDPRYTFDKGTFVIEVRIKTGGREFRNKYQLVNEDEFMLKDITI